MENESKKDMTVYDLAQMMMDGFGRVNGKIDKLTNDLEDFKNETKSNFKHLEDKIDRIDHRAIVLKQVIEKDLKTPVRW